MGSTVVTAAHLDERSRTALLAYAGLGFSALAWASAFIAGKFVLAEMSALGAGSARYLIAAAVLLPFAWRQRPRRGVQGVSALAVMVLCGGLLYQWIFLTALQRTSATNTSLLIALNPVMTALAAPLIGEGLRRVQIAGVVLALLGAATVITRGDLGTLAGVGFNSGDLFALAAAAVWATFNLASRRTVEHFAPSFTNCAVYLIGGLALWALAWDESPLTHLFSLSTSALAAMFVLAIVASVCSGQLFLFGVRTLGVNRAVVFVYFVPVLTALLAAALLGEDLGPGQLLGGATVMAGVALVNARA